MSPPETLIAKVRTTPGGTITRVTGTADTSLYGPVEIAWYPDHLTIRAVGAGPSSITHAHAAREGQDVVVEIRPPELDELPNGLPGAD
jgi:hypothetical protein